MLLCAMNRHGRFMASCFLFNCVTNCVPIIYLCRIVLFRTSVLSVLAYIITYNFRSGFMLFEYPLSVFCFIKIVCFLWYSTEYASVFHARLCHKSSCSFHYKQWYDVYLLIAISVNKSENDIVWSGNDLLVSYFACNQAVFQTHAALHFFMVRGFNYSAVLSHVRPEK